MLPAPDQKVIRENTHRLEGCAGSQTASPRCIEVFFKGLNQQPKVKEEPGVRFRRGPIRYGLTFDRILGLVNAQALIDPDPEDRVVGQEAVASDPVDEGAEGEAAGVDVGGELA